MNKEVKKNKYYRERALKNASLATGVAPLVLAQYYVVLWAFDEKLDPPNMLDLILVIVIICITLILPITAIVCGSIDLVRINKGIYAKKGEVYDILGIALGLVGILFGIFLAVVFLPRITNV